MADQKALKKRLKVLMLRPDNQICSDCPEKKPTWASLVVPPPGSPPGTTKIGAFCCLECSGSHRRLGVHISFVRSVNLDSWKEEEVRAMENGGNAVVNSIFEARLAQSGMAKPTNLADGPTRERFIRDKYERRKYFDPSGYANVGNPAAIPQSPSSGPGPSPSRGTPSDVARQRVANRQAHMRTAHSQMEAPTPAPASRPSVAPAPVSAPVVMDLLDFGDFSPAPAPAPASSTPVHDPFAPSASAAPAPVATPADPFASQPSATPAPLPAPQRAPAPSAPGSEFLAPPSATVAKPPASADSILALFNTPPQPMSFAPASSGMNHHNLMMMGAGGNNHNTHGGMNMNMNSGGMVPQQQQQQHQMMMMNRNMMGMQNMPQNQQNNQQHNMMMQNMMNPQQQSQMGMNGQQNMMMMNPQQQMMGGMMNGNHQQNNNNFNSMMQGMQQMNMNMGNQNPMGMGMGINGGMQQSGGGDGGDGGFGTPMGGSAPTAKNDPFSSLGGMNAFR